MRGILYDRLGVNEGMFFENFVAQTLVAKDRDLLFYSRPNPKVEIDFMVRNGIKICPVEVKSAGYRTHASLDWLISHYPGKLGAKYVICTSDYKVEDGVAYLPFYMAHCI